MEFIGTLVKILKVKNHSVNQLFLVCLGPVLVGVFSPRSGGPSPKEMAVSHLCGVSLMLCLTMGCVAGSLYCGQTVGVGRGEFCQGDSSLWHHEFVLPGLPQIGDSRL